MKILMLSIDEKIFNPDSPVARRMSVYGDNIDELHIVVYTKKGFNTKRIGSNVFVYPTNTAFKPLYFLDAFVICRPIVRKKVNLVTSQEAMTNLLGVLLKILFRTKLEVQIHTDFTNKYFVRESFVNFLRFVGYKIGILFANSVRVVSQRIANSVSHKNIVVLPIVYMANGGSEPVPNYGFEKTILMVSRITKEKNISLALKSFKKVLKKDKNVGLVIVGSGPESASLEILTKDLGIRERVVFEGWKDNVSSYYQVADVFLSTSNYEGYGLSLVEAAMSKLPIVTTNVGIAGYELKGPSIFICKVNDIDCIADNLFSALRYVGKPEFNLRLLNIKDHIAKQKTSWSMIS